MWLQTKGKEHLFQILRTTSAWIKVKQMKNVCMWVGYTYGIKKTLHVRKNEAVLILRFETWVKVFVPRWCLNLRPHELACQAPLSMGFSRQEYWVGCHFLLQGIFPTQGLNPTLLYCRQILYHQNRQRSLNIKVSVQLHSVAQSCLTLCDPMNCSTPGLPVHIKV